MTIEPGEQIDLRRPDGSSPSAVRVELQWSPHRAGDLYAQAVMFAGDRWRDAVGFLRRRSDDGAVTQVGRDGPEDVLVSLGQVNRRVTRIAFVLLAFAGDTFDAIEYCDLWVSDLLTGDLLALVDVGSNGPHAAMVMAAIRRRADGWALKAIGEPSTARRFEEINAAIRPHL